MIGKILLVALFLVSCDIGDQADDSEIQIAELSKRVNALERENNALDREIFEKDSIIEELNAKVSGYEDTNAALSEELETRNFELCVQKHENARMNTVDGRIYADFDREDKQEAQELIESLGLDPVLPPSEYKEEGIVRFEISVAEGEESEYRCRLESYDIVLKTYAKRIG